MLGDKVRDEFLLWRSIKLTLILNCAQQFSANHYFAQNFEEPPGRSCP